MLQAFELARGHAPLRDWVGIKPRLIAASLARELGAPLLGRAQISLAWREAPHDARVAVRFGHEMMSRRGPLAVLEFLDSIRDQVTGSAEDRADLSALKGTVLAEFRDFERAHRCVEEALHIDPDNRWSMLARAHVLMAEDRYSEAVEQVRIALAAWPSMISACGLMAHLMQLEGHDDEAVNFLEEKTQRFESSSLALQLASVYSERRDFTALGRALDRYEALAPLLEPRGRQSLAAHRTEVAYAHGDVLTLVSLAERSKSIFHMRIADRLKAGRRPGACVLLPVGFVRQHHKTCVPATLSAISRFWGRPTDHLEIAEEICYDGTTSHAERAWAESKDWAVREFTVCWTATQALIDRGIPFTLTTRQGESGHLQAVIGYDDARGTIFLRDPTFYHHMEAIAEPLFESLASCGPRGMAMVPSDQTSRLDGLDLPDALLHDYYFRFESALRAHDRNGALVSLQAIVAAAPDHRLALLAQAALATFDVDPAARHAALQRSADHYPGDVLMQLLRLGTLEELGRHAELRSALEALCASAQGDPIFWIHHGRMLAEDARRNGEATRWIRRAIRAQPDNPKAYHALADVLLRLQGADRSLDLYRLAACLGDKDEAVAMAYFRAMRLAGRQAEALQFLEARWQKLGHRSPAAAVSLARALIEIDKDVRAFEILESAMDVHRDNGGLMLIAAQTLQARGRAEGARVLLNRAKGRCPDTDYLKTCARIAMQQGDRQGAGEAWHRLAAQDPSSVEAHAALAILACADRGPVGALEHIDEAIARSPHHVGLRRLQLEWVRMFRPDRLEAMARSLVEVSPCDIEARLQWCSSLALQGRTEQAIEQARLALEIAPMAPMAGEALGCLLAETGHADEARKILLEAVDRSVDLPAAIHSLVFQLPATHEERRGVLAHLVEELRHHPTTGEGLQAMAAAGAVVWQPDELRATLEELLQAHADLPAAWSAVISQAPNPDAAHRALAAVERFPLTSDSWIDLASARFSMKDTHGEIEALERALEMKPAWRMAIRLLAQAHLRVGNTDAALAILNREFPTEMPDPDHEAQVATMLWTAGNREQAVARLENLLQLQPRSEQGWDLLAGWSAELGRDLTEVLARKLTRERPDDPGAWIGLARGLRRPGDFPERLAALWRAQDLAPRDIGAHDLEAELLTRSGHFDQALTACRPAVWGDDTPLALRGRGAWVLWCRGHRRAAKAVMRTLLDVNVFYRWGWKELISWVRSSEGSEVYAEAAARWVWLEPQNAVGHFCQGEALLRCGQRAEAKASLRRALALDPSFGPAAAQLLKSLLEDEEFDDTQAALEICRNLLPAPFVLAHEVRLLCARGPRADAIGAFHRLCLLPEAEWDDLATASDSMAAADLGKEAAGILERSLTEPVASPWVLAIWIAVKIVRDHDVAGCVKMLRDMKDFADRWEHGCSQLIGWFQQGGGQRSFDEFLGEHGRQLHTGNRTWSSVLEALVSLGEYHRARTWADGWESRGQLPPDVCWKISLAYRACGDDAEASRLVRHGIENGHHDHEALRTWAVFDEARSGDPIEARRRLRDLDDTDLEMHEAFLAALTRGMMAIEPSSAKNSGPAFAQARSWLRKAERRYPEYHRDLIDRRVFQQALDKIASVRGGWIATLWRIWRKPPQNA